MFLRESGSAAQPPIAEPPAQLCAQQPRGFKSLSSKKKRKEGESAVLGENRAEPTNACCFFSDATALGRILHQLLRMLRAHGQNKEGVKVLLQADSSVWRAGKKSSWYLAHTARSKSQREYFTGFVGLSCLPWVQELLSDLV